MTGIVLNYRGLGIFTDKLFIDREMKIGFEGKLMIIKSPDKTGLRLIFIR